MTNLEHLESLKKFDDNNAPGNLDNMTFYNYRQAKALEIIAEEKIKTNDILSTISVILEDIITVLRQR